jgi:hypothetical protein
MAWNTSIIHWTAWRAFSAAVVVRAHAAWKGMARPFDLLNAKDVCDFVSRAFAGVDMGGHHRFATASVL